MTHDRQNQVYNERNTLVIALARTMLALGYKAGYALDADRLAAGWDKDWATVVYIDLPDGAQISYHMNDVTAEAARALPEYDGDGNGKFTGREVPTWLIHMRDLEVLAPSAAVAAPFAHFVQPGGFGPFIECEASRIGAFPAYRVAAPAIEGGIEQAAKFIENRAKAYIEEQASTEHDTGAVVFYCGEAGREYHSGLVELAEEIRALAAAPSASVGGA